MSHDKCLHFCLPPARGRWGGCPGGAEHRPKQGHRRGNPDHTKQPCLRRAQTTPSTPSRAQTKGTMHCRGVEPRCEPPFPCQKAATSGRHRIKHQKQDHTRSEEMHAHCGPVWEGPASSVGEGWRACVLWGERWAGEGACRSAPTPLPAAVSSHASHRRRRTRLQAPPARRGSRGSARGDPGAWGNRPSVAHGADEPHPPWVPALGLGVTVRFAWAGLG